LNQPIIDARINPVKLSLDSTFCFDCHKNVSCFTECCNDINIILTPYDIIRLKNRLGLSSEEFLQIYTEPQLLEKTDLPIVTLKMLDNEKKSCPFVREDGCIIYKDRPTACRYYPLGSGVLAHKDDVDNQDGFYFFIHEPHCKGFEEKSTWTVKSFKDDQGVEDYDAINHGWNELIVMKRSFPSNMHFTDKAKELFFMMSYNVDQFARFLQDSSFIQIHQINPDTAQKIMADEIERIQFGYKFLKWLLFKQGDFSVNQDLAEKRKNKAS